MEQCRLEAQDGVRGNGAQQPSQAAMDRVNNDYGRCVSGCASRAAPKLRLIKQRVQASVAL